MLWCSGLACYFQVLLTTILIPVLIYNHNRNPQPFMKLCYASNGWILYDLSGQNTLYKTAQIRFDGGFFVLLVLQQDNYKQMLVIFRDQMSTQQYRMLRLMEKIEKKIEDVKI